MKRGKGKLALKIAVIGFAALALGGCSWSGQASHVNASQENAFDPMVASIQQDGQFVVGGLPWLISKQEVLGKLQPDRVQSDSGDKLVAEGRLPLDASVKQTVIYHFQDDQLVSGEYLFTTTDQSRFAQLSQELKGLLSRSLPEPQVNSTAVLDQAGESAQQGSSVGWQGPDRSQLRVNVLMTEEQQYLLQIQIASPLPERQSLN